MEKRKFERFEIEMPARMETTSSMKKQAFDLVTKNISASGAYLSTSSLFSDGLRVKLSLIALNKKLFEITGLQSLIECEGSIVRTTPTGLAIWFDRECQITSLKDS
jgi:hypothetical protein